MSLHTLRHSLSSASVQVVDREFKLMCQIFTISGNLVTKKRFKFYASIRNVSKIKAFSKSKIDETFRKNLLGKLHNIIRAFLSFSKKDNLDIETVKCNTSIDEFSVPFPKFSCLKSQRDILFFFCCSFFLVKSGFRRFSLIF